MTAFHESEEVNPLGDRVEQLLTETEPQVTPQQLLEIVTEHLQSILPGTLKGKARQNVLTFLVETEYRHSLRGHISRAVMLRQAGRWNDSDPLDNSNRVDDLIKEYRVYAGDIEAGSDDLPLIDQPVGPGALTKLHLAAMDGEYEEVVRLVEVENASVRVLDNMKKTPYDRARAFGHHQVAEYLLKRQGR